MVDELGAEHPELALGFVHVNGVGHANGLRDLDTITDLPVVQDDIGTGVWNAWGADWRDVYVLDRDNELYAVFNLSDHPLEDPANYAALYALFVEAGSAG